MLSIFGFLVILGPLVIFHEFGHYVFARLFNVKAEIFSIGFGPRLWGRQIGETEWRFSAIPLGGYVKLLGEEADHELSPDELKRSLSRQAAWKRFLIFFGGPLFNFILAVAIFMAILAIGEPQFTSTIGRVMPGSAAARAGFVSGDHVVSVDGKVIQKYEELANVISDNPQRKIRFDLERGPQKSHVSIEAMPTAQKGYSLYGEPTTVGEIEGMNALARDTTFGVSDHNGLAGQAGFATGDHLVSFNQKPIRNWESFEADYLALPEGAAVTLVGESSEKKSHHMEFVKHGALGTQTGLWSSELFIDKTVPHSPAEAAGLLPGDRLVAIDGKAVSTFFELREAVQNQGETKGAVPLQWERAGKISLTTIVPTKTTSRDPELNKTVQYTIGVVPLLNWAEPDTVIERIWNPVLLFYKGIERTFLFSYRNLVSIGKMLKGDVSIGTLGGPILIGKIAGESISRGLIAFLSTMAMLSVGLGVLNLLPVPLLDGGHLVLLGLEAIRGKPLSIRQMEIIQQVGLSLILILMGIVMRNDLARLPFFNGH